ncbi:conserved protein of unknown function [Mesotoga infera]|uniref:DUF4894 domain-containing protein n=2 Tax=Mesotoga infera TaxID=1236046 RepID=A0A7Z7LHU8_9BACT|nr:conserved protein of unknown function [Mesotoga infera]
MSLSLRAAICMVAIIAIWFVAIINFIVESFFTVPLAQFTKIVNPEETVIEFPLAFRRRWKTDIIYPPATVDVSGNRVFLKPGKYIVFYDDSYYWVSEDFVIVDHASMDEITSFPVVGGLNFVLVEGVYKAIDNNIDDFTGAVEGILAERRISRLVAYFDYRNNTLFLRRGITIKVLDWEKLSASKELLLQLENASDRSEYIFLSDGKLLRAR